MKKRVIVITTALACCFIVCLAAIADINGIWVGSIRAPDGTDVTLTYNFKIKGDQLTGSAESNGLEIPVDSGKVTGNEIKFSVTNGDGVLVPHNGRYFPAGDSISMDLSIQGMKFHTKLIRTK